MNLLVKLIPNRICIGCGCHGYTDEKTLLCLSCLDIKIRVEERKRKLSDTMRLFFAYAAEWQEKQRKKLEENIWTLGNPDFEKTKREVARKLAELRK